MYRYGIVFLMRYRNMQLQLGSSKTHLFNMSPNPTRMAHSEYVCNQTANMHTTTSWYFKILNGVMHEINRLLHLVTFEKILFYKFRNFRDKEFHQNHFSAFWLRSSEEFHQKHSTFVMQAQNEGTKIQDLPTQTDN